MPKQSKKEEEFVDKPEDSGAGPEGPEAEPIEAEVLGRRSPLVILADAALAVERVRIGAKIRLTHLGKRGATCAHTAALLERSGALEKWVDTELAELIHQHPAAPWFTKVKGTGGEAIGKVIGHIENFGRFYPSGDPWIPPYVKREAVMVPVPSADDANELVEKPMVWVEGIERLTTPSKLRKYAGLVPGQKRVSGARLEFNLELRTMLWRLGTSLLKAGGKYYEQYSAYKAYLQRRFAEEGVRILPTPRGRFCAACEKTVTAPAARYCPTCGEALVLKTEPPGVRWAGHVHLMAQRRMIQLFLDHLWATWREALHLPLRTPYPVEYLGHSQIITHWDMVDR